MMSQLDRLEALAQNLIEGTFKRFSHTQAQDSNGQTQTEEKLSVNTNLAAKKWGLQMDTGRLQLGEPVINLGRALDNDIVFSDPTVSRYHAQLRWRGGQYYLCSPTPENGMAGNTQKMGQSAPQTTVNQQPVSAQHPLSSGDIITFGSTILTVFVQQV